LAAAPELIIVKNRSGAYDWPVYCKYAPNFGGLPGYSYLNSTNSFNSTDAWPSTPFTSTTFNVVNYSGFLNYLNASGANYVAYLWATNPGVTKVGSYTGNGSTQTINCGFTGGSRFVMIKATNTNSGWWIYDTARGMTTVTDPFLQLNSTASETATSGSVTTVTTGFAVNEAVLAGINTNGNSYIFLSYA
jgi:hypothetical protein